MADLDELLAAVGAGFEGDADAAADVFTDDATFRDNADQPEIAGRDAIRQFFSAYGGRREQFEVTALLREGERAAVEYALRFRADAHAFEQQGVALVEVRDGLLSAWRGIWVETDADEAAWR